MFDNQLVFYVVLALIVLYFLRQDAVTEGYTLSVPNPMKPERRHIDVYDRYRYGYGFTTPDTCRTVPYWGNYYFERVRF